MRAQSTLLHALRAGTANLHGDVERSPCLERLLSPALELPEYVAILERFRRFHATQEARLAIDTLPRPLRRRTNLRRLARDLDGYAGRGMPQEPSREVRDEASSTAPPATVGILYVLEGSALGGIVIGRHLATLPALRGRTAFFARPAAAVARRWRVFCAWVASLDSAPAGFHQAAVLGAEEAFAAAQAEFSANVAP